MIVSEGRVRCLVRGEKLKFNKKGGEMKKLKDYSYSCSFRGVEVGNTSFQKAKLPGADFRELKVTGPVDFREAEIAGSDFRGTDLSQFDFTGVDVNLIIIDEDQIKNLKGVKPGTRILVPDESQPRSLREVVIPLKIFGKTLKYPPGYENLGSPF